MKRNTKCSCIIHVKAITYLNISKVAYNNLLFKLLVCENYQDIAVNFIRYLIIVDKDFRYRITDYDNENIIFARSLRHNRYFST